MPVVVPNCGTYEVELDFGASTNAIILDDSVAGVLNSPNYFLEGTTDFKDVTTYVKRVSINRGRQNRFREDSGQASTATIEIEDRDFSFSLVNEGSPFYNVAKGRLGFELNSDVRISRNGVYLFTGIITQYKQSIEKPNRSLVTISCSDALFQLNNSKTTFFTATPETSNTRIDKVLTNAGVFSKSGQRIFETGVANLGNAPVDETASVLESILRINNSEQGRVWVDGSGNFHFDRRLTGELQSINATFSDTGGTAIPFTTFDIVSN